jgi:hypothetical protein
MIEEPKPKQYGPGGKCEEFYQLSQSTNFHSQKLRIQLQLFLNKQQ